MNLEPLLGLAGFVVLVQLVTGMLKAMGSKALARAVVAIGALGIPLHELGHAIPALLFRMRVDEVDLLSAEPGGRGYSGHVTHRAPSSAAGAVAVFCGPLVVASAVISLLGEVIVQQAAAGLDPACLFLIFVAAVSVAMASTPSGDDIANVLRAAGRFKGQAAVTVLGMLAAAWVLWMVDVPLAPWWWLLVDALVVLGSGTACCKAYARARSPRLYC